MAQSPSEKQNLYEGYTTLKGWKEEVPELSEEMAEYYQREMQRVAFQPGTRVLELGFGEGTFLDWAREQGAQVAGVEIQESLCNRVQKRHGDVYHGRLPALVEAGELTGPFDLIVAFDVFEHLEREDLIAHFHAFFKVLAPGGQVLSRFPNGQSPFGRAYQNGDITHQVALTAFSLEQVGVMTGFSLKGAYNAARVMSNHPLKKIHRGVVYQMRNAVEWMFGQIYFMGTMPMDPTLTVVMEKK